MTGLIRGILGRALLLVLALLAAGSAYAVFIQFPADQTFWKVAFTLIVLAVTLTCALCSSLTFGTRYLILGILGVASALLSAVTVIYSLWNGKASGSGIAGMPTSPTEAINSFVGSTTGNSIGVAIVFIIALTALALPLINVVLYFAYQSNTVGELLGIMTAASIVANIVIFGVSTANQSWGALTIKWSIFLAILAVVGIVGTPVAASFDSDAADYASKHRVHYDIKSDEKPSALPESLQPKKKPQTYAEPVHEDPPMPELDYNP